MDLGMTAPSTRGRASLNSLPIDILNQIHVLSGSEHLPIINRHFREIFGENLKSDHYRAEYLYHKYFVSTFVTIKQFSISISNHFKYSKQEEEEKIHRDQKKFYDSRGKSTSLWESVLSNRACSLKALRYFIEKIDRDSLNNNSQKFTAVKVPTIPIRLLNSLRDYDQLNFEYSDHDLEDQRQNSIYEFIRTLLTEFQTSPNQPSGYPLARSLLTRDLRMVRLLLDFDADLECKNDLIVKIAIAIGDLDLIRVLIEPNFKHPLEATTATKTLKIDKSCDNERVEKGELKTVESNGTSRDDVLKLYEKIKSTDNRLDRIKVTDQMLEMAIEYKKINVAHYFIDKGARPTTEAIRLIEILL
ncbi:hypothetical protein BY996DRAFT_6408226 [Phakopsora pachyrhizi]|nr:hypothetical protein BY996DRAFT_6408226 [Phakopsora pachyrhizi]